VKGGEEGAWLEMRRAWEVERVELLVCCSWGEKCVVR
jgi:hypothetical protein